MTFTIRPAIRKDTPLIIGLAGPSKSGKTYSAHRLARGLAHGGMVVMINAEGARGHQYADVFSYQALDIDPPYSYGRYDEALCEVAKLRPACVIVDSISHAHDGPGGMIEEHDADVERRAGDDYKKRDRVTWAAWIKPKQAENKFIYRMLSMDCPIVLCFRAKEKIKIVAGKDPIDLGYQPISSERIAFETMFSLLLPPRSKGVPDLSLSDLRSPFDEMISGSEAIDEKLGERLGAWAAGAKSKDSTSGSSAQTGHGGAGAAAMNPDAAPEYVTPDQVANLETLAQDKGVPLASLRKVAKVERLAMILAVDYQRSIDWINRAAESKAAA